MSTSLFPACRVSIHWLLCAAAALLLAGCNTPPRSGPSRVSGIAVKNLSQDGDVWIGGAPTADGLAQLKERGVKTVIDLQQPGEKSSDEAGAAAKLGMDYVAIPMTSNKLTNQQAEAFLDAMRDRSGGVLIHCGSANRGGAMYGLYLGTMKQCPVQQALKQARAAGLRDDYLARDVRKQIESKAVGP